MEITRAQIKKVNKLYADVAEIGEEISEMLKDIQDKHGENEIALTRDGKIVEIKEKHLWQEVYYGVKQSQDIMREKYPKLFKLYDKQQILTKALKEYVYSNFGIDFQKIRLVDVINIVDAIVRLYK